MCVIALAISGEPNVKLDTKPEKENDHEKHFRKERGSTEDTTPDGVVNLPCRGGDPWEEDLDGGGR